MRVILSHPYSGAFYWWMQSAGEYPAPTRPSHPYYRHLYGPVEQNIDMALSCAVIFDEILIPAADTHYPDSISSKGNREISIPSLDVLADWEPGSRVHDVIYGRSHNRDSWLPSEIETDSRLSQILRKVPRNLRSYVVEDVIKDILMMRKYNAPIVSSPGRRAMLVRLLEINALENLGINDAEISTPRIRVEDKSALIEQASVDELSNYVTVTGLTFRSPDVRALSGIKSNALIRDYAERFQDILVNRTREPDSADLNESIRRAWKSRHLQDKIASGFSTTSRGLSMLGLVPVLGTITGAAAIGTETAAVVNERLKKKNSWYEIGPQILRLESLDALERHLGGIG